MGLYRVAIPFCCPDFRPSELHEIAVWEIQQAKHVAPKSAVKSPFPGSPCNSSKPSLCPSSCRQAGNTCSYPQSDLNHSGPPSTPDALNLVSSWSRRKLLCVNLASNHSLLAGSSNYTDSDNSWHHKCLMSLMRMEPWDANFLINAHDLDRAGEVVGSKKTQ